MMDKNRKEQFIYENVTLYFSYPFLLLQDERKKVGKKPKAPEGLKHLEEDSDNEFQEGKTPAIQDQTIQPPPLEKDQLTKSLKVGMLRNKRSSMGLSNNQNSGKVSPTKDGDVRKQEKFGGLKLQKSDKTENKGAIMKIVQKQYKLLPGLKADETDFRPEILDDIYEP